MVVKVVISETNSGLSVQHEIDDKVSKAIIGLKIGDVVNGDSINMKGYEFVLTGGSDFCGFPMRKDVQGVGRKKIFAYEGVGLRRQRRGMLQRKTVCGNTVHEKIAQINMTVTKQGAEDFFAEARKKFEEKKASLKTKDSKPADTSKSKETAKPEQVQKPEAKTQPKASKKESHSESKSAENKEANS